MQATVLAAIGACLLSCATRLHAGQLDVVSVTATGFGTSIASATVDAVRNGVRIGERRADRIDRAREKVFDVSHRSRDAKLADHR